MTHKSMTVNFSTKMKNSEVEQLYINGLLISEYNVHSEVGKDVKKLLKGDSFGGVF